MGDTVPSDLVAVYDNFRLQWWLYYISTDAQLKIIQGPKDGQLEDAATNPPYVAAYVDVAKYNVPTPKAGNSQLGVVEYLDTQGNPQVRIIVHVRFIAKELVLISQSYRRASTTLTTTTTW